MCVLSINKCFFNKFVFLSIESDKKGNLMVLFYCRTSPRQTLESSSSDLLRLTLSRKLSLPLFTGGKVEGDQGLPIHIVLEDTITGGIVTTGPASSAKLQVVVLDGDFGNDEDEWTAEDFENNVVKEREGKRPLLTGDLTVTLKEGVGTLGELAFTDNSSWIRSRKFRLGVRVIPGYLQGIHIQECRTEAFTVKDHRGERKSSVVSLFCFSHRPFIISFSVFQSTKNTTHRL